MILSAPAPISRVSSARDRLLKPGPEQALKGLEAASAGGRETRDTVALCALPRRLSSPDLKMQGGDALFRGTDAVPGRRTLQSLAARIRLHAEEGSPRTLPETYSLAARLPCAGEYERAMVACLLQGVYKEEYRSFLAGLSGQYKGAPLSVSRLKPNFDRPPAPKKEGEDVGVQVYISPAPPSAADQSGPATKRLPEQFQPASKMLPPGYTLPPAPEPEGRDKQRSQPSDRSQKPEKADRQAEKEAKEAKESRKLIQQLLDDGALFDPSEQAPDHRLGMKDVEGLEDAKEALRQSIFLPLRMPKLFSKRPMYRGILLHGPPGSGKTFLCRCAASEANVSFVFATASNIMSKWQGQSERMVRALFDLTVERAPCLLLLDELDGLCGARGDEDGESTRRVKNEFLLQLDRVNEFNKQAFTDLEHPKFVVVLGATNFPYQIDSAIRRRFERRIYVGLPSREARYHMLRKGMPSHLSDEQVWALADYTDMYSGADLSVISKNVGYAPLAKLQKSTRFYRVPGGPWRTEGDPGLQEDQKARGGQAALEEKECRLEELSGDIEEPILNFEEVEAIAKRVNRSVSDADIKAHERFCEEFDTM